ncbi:MAG: division/cell wall cluster transcriptional repressor MraZ, partial [Planctomycetota bacterium]
SANEIVLDKNNRFVVPETQKNEAGMEKDVVFIGMWDRVEVWDKERWIARKKDRAGKQSPPKPDKPS